MAPQTCHWSHSHALLHEDECPRRAWLVSKMGRLTAGVQYEPEYGSKEGKKYRNLKNWSCGNRLWSGIKQPFESIIQLWSRAIKKFSGSLPHSINMWWSKDGVDDTKSSNDVPESSYVPQVPDSTFQVAASWQANKNFC
ncbi:hypothetical protein GBA52_011928 [Prunus armeniaca]|nr:hypothetical protein GBA52_011928 [Prunus armeniaca]